jgi:hypothetical protein
MEGTKQKKISKLLVRRKVHGSLPSYKHTENKKWYASHSKYAIHELITIDIKG